MTDQLRLLEEATRHEFLSMSDTDIEKLRHDLNKDKMELQEQADEIERLLSMINIRDRVKAAGRAA